MSLQIMIRFLYQLIRFGLRKVLRLWPRRRHVRVGLDAERIGILFAGTYGDFVQVLPMLHETARLWPKAKVLLWAPEPYFKAFEFALPLHLSRVNGWQLLLGIFFPWDLVLMNAVCVYRLRYELLSLRLGRASAGFRYAHEPYRSGLGWSLPLTPEVANFSEANYQLPQVVAASKLPIYQPLPWRARIDPNAPFPFSGPILFSVGSAGFKKALGLPTYLRWIDAVMAVLGEVPLTFVLGPDDVDLLAHLVKNYPMRAYWRYSIETLAEKVKDWPGCLLGFDSFMAHFALYLGRRMVVLHREKIPHGYNCSPYHFQIVIPSLTVGGADPDLQPLVEFLNEAQGMRVRQELPDEG